MEPVKILFICSSLEPGKDGVGDYTRKLACALNKEGSLAKIIAINDRRFEDKSFEGFQYDEDTETEVLRLSSTLPWNVRLQKTKTLIQNFNPEWISLQYVPFGFHLKGLPFTLANKLKQVAAMQRWHVMFHELSVNRDESFKFKIWSLLQVKIIQSLLTKLKPAVIHTNTELYKYRLKEMGFKASVLPLFSNISKTIVKDEEIYNNIIPAFIYKYPGDYIIGTLFGSFDFKRWDMRTLLQKFNYSFSKKRIVIVSLGRMNAGQDCWEQLKKDFPQVIFISLGEQSSGFISYWLSHYTDFGILTTLPELAGKSGSFMAFKEHGVPVVCKEKTPSLKTLSLPVEEELIEVNTDEKFQLPLKQKPVSQLQLVTGMFIKSLSEVDVHTKQLHLQNTD